MIVNGKTQGMWPTWMYEAKVEKHEEIFKEFSPCLDDDSFLRTLGYMEVVVVVSEVRRMMHCLGKCFLKIFVHTHNSILTTCNQ